MPAACPRCPLGTSPNLATSLAAVPEVARPGVVSLAELGAVRDGHRLLRARRFSVDRQGKALVSNAAER
jgi:hypothetical protein